MKKSLITLSLAALLGGFAFQASATTLPGLDPSVARAERPEKPQKPEKKEKVGATEAIDQFARAEVEKPQRPEKKEKVGAIEGSFQLAREASERPRGADNDRRGGRRG